MRLVSKDGLTWENVDWLLGRHVFSLRGEVVSLGSLFEAIEAEEAEARGRVEQLVELQLADMTERLGAERERLSRLLGRCPCLPQTRHDRG
ncbi:hypothetical protein BN159_0447 [Streptomyces davaonensis JCM 4913]|uniref:Uncharacterized protein n=1 Tax=Streptomyces davaonensis (strain DSM 101723 / JCM 4913 / KCC S-0913 / 768) TaxID=1214101 RepID=K4QSK8_STRDJ|nr:hypothetical protein BN159_0447 [Streptomyces davaonensis JCM 4913]